jgi:hypothetical protein
MSLPIPSLCLLSAFRVCRLWLAGPRFVSNPFLVYGLYGIDADLPFPLLEFGRSHVRVCVRFAAAVSCRRLCFRFSVLRIFGQPLGSEPAVHPDVDTLSKKALFLIPVALLLHVSIHCLCPCCHLSWFALSIALGYILGLTSLGASCCAISAHHWHVLQYAFSVRVHA